MYKLFTFSPLRSECEHGTVFPRIEARGMTLHVEGTHWVAASMTAKRKANYVVIIAL